MDPLARLRRVSSRQNSLVKELRRAFSRSELTGDGHAAIESVRLIEEAIRSGLRFKAVFVSESGKARAERLMPQLGAHVETLLLDDETFASAVATESPQGVAALVRLKEFTLPQLLAPAPALVMACAGIQDPGNLGTMIRSAEAFGATGLLLGEKTVSRLNPKVVRGAAGSLFRMPFLEAELLPTMERLREAGVRLLGTSPHKGATISESDLKVPVAVFIGNEGAGLPREVAQAMDGMVTIPHAGPAESLNAGVAASVILYEALRQRRSGESGS